jgi:4-amino-4-deoxy-L-arabinose transferase-like glycosyltransferase
MSQTKVPLNKTLVERIRPTVALPIIALLGFSLRLFVLQFRFAIAFDEVSYLKLGVSGYLNGIRDIFHTYWSPLLPAFIAFTCNFLGDYEFAARLVSVLAGTALIFPVYFLGKWVYDNKVGITAAGFVALFPPLAFQSTQVLSEPIYMLAASCAVLFGLRMLIEGSWRQAAFAGACSAFAYLAHPQGIGFLLVLIAWLLYGLVFRPFQPNGLGVLIPLVALLISFLAVSAPYLLYLKQQTGTWTLSAKASANMQMDAPKTEEGDPFRSLDPSNRVVPVDQIFHQGNFLQSGQSAPGPIREVRIAPMIGKYIKNIADILKSAIPEFLTTLPMILLGIGLLGRGWQPKQGVLLLYLLSFIAFYWFGVIPTFHINLRYFTPLWPICSIWIAKGALEIHGWLSSDIAFPKSRWVRGISSDKLAAAVVFSAFLGLTFLPEIGRVASRRPDSTQYWADPVDQKIAGLWLKEHAADPKVVMSRYHTADIYAGNFEIAQSVTLPRSSLDRVLEYARYRGVRYLLLNERYIEWYPQMRFLLSGTNGQSDLNLIYRDVDQGGLTTVIYEIL